MSAPAVNQSHALSEQQRADARAHVAWLERQVSDTNGPFPLDPYPITLAEVCLRMDALTARVLELERWHADATGQTERIPRCRICAFHEYSIVNGHGLSPLMPHECSEQD